jgi:hypothetical protein
VFVRVRPWLIFLFSWQQLFWFIPGIVDNNSDYLYNNIMKKKESTKEPIISKHDQEFKDFFNAREVACSFFQEYLPPKIKAKFDFNTLEIVR